MLRRLTVALMGLSVAISIAACSSTNNSNLNVGPNFPTGTLYAANANQNAVSLFLVGKTTTTTASYQIGGSNTTLNGPQYLAFDAFNNLWVTNYNPSTQAGLILEFRALATGNVLPFGTIAFSGQPRGIAIDPTTSQMLVAGSQPTAAFPSLLQVYTLTTTAGGGAPLGASLTIGGPATGLNVPSGAAFAADGTYYVSNLASPSIESFVVPSPTPTPKPTPTPTPTPKPTPTPSTSPSPTIPPTASPSPTPDNFSPKLYLTSPVLKAPAGITLDGTGHIYVADAGAASVFVFAAGLAGHVSATPIRTISGSATKLQTPTDVKVDSSGNIYVGDSTANRIFVFSPTANGNVAPLTTYTSNGTVIGIGLIP